MINFIRSAFIRKNTPELRKRLEELGYKPVTNTPSNEHLCLATTRHGRYVAIPAEIFDSTNPHVTWNCAGRIDCGTNEDLFLAIAALRSDNDYMQYFTDGKDNWFKCVDEHLDPMLTINAFGIGYYKTMVEELIEHFEKE